MAFEHHRAGRLERAAALYRKILKKAPNNPDALQLLGVIALTEGRAERAIQLIGKAIAVSPNYAEAHSNLGNAQLAAGRPTEARASYVRAIDLNPGFAPAHNNLGRALCEMGDFTDALASCEQAVKLAPDLAEAHNNLGNALRGLGRLEAAESAFRRALYLEPGSAVRYTNLGNVLADRKRYDEAEACYRRAIEIDPDFSLAHYALATRLRLAGRMEAAVESYRKAASLTPAQPLLWNDLGRALRALGRFEEATAAFREALAADPDFSDAYRNLATCQQLVDDERTIARLAGLAARHDLSIDERVAAGFALGKVLDDAGRFDEAFTAYERTNRLYCSSRSTVEECFDASRLRSEVDAAINRFTPKFFASVADWGSASELPVFILGMPRSGTSLVEQIAASHSQVFGGGELKDIGDLAAALQPVFDEIWIRLNAHPRSCTDEARHAVRRLAHTHLERLHGLSRYALRIIDKMPDNVFKLHAIAMLFPGARVIFCRRDPRDVCLSCYFQKFAAGQLVFSYDLIDCAKRYLETHRLAEHWRQVLPLRFLDVQYEALVADLENESRRIVAFLGLEWEPACLDFHRTDRTVATASAWQVRQPVYRSAVGRWRNYERHLAPLLDTLAAGGHVVES